MVVAVRVENPASALLCLRETCTRGRSEGDAAGLTSAGWMCSSAVMGSHQYNSP